MIGFVLRRIDGTYPFAGHDDKFSGDIMNL